MALRIGELLIDNEGEHATFLGYGPDGMYRVRYSWDETAKGMLLEASFFRTAGEREPVRTFTEYGTEAIAFVVYPPGPIGGYSALALAGEAGEVAGHLAKAARDDGGEITEARRRALLLELGDVLWCLNALATELGFTLAEVANANLDKLEGRRARGTIGGSGDDR